MKNIKLIAIIVLVLISSMVKGQWITKNVQTSTDLYSVEYYDNNNIFIGIGDSLIKSSNGGVSWNSYPLLTIYGAVIPASAIYDMHFIDPLTGFATGIISMANSEVVMKTVNGGLNWETVHAYNSGTWPRYLNEIDFVTNNYGFAAGTNGRFVRSTNGGSTWSSLSTGLSIELKSLDFISSTVGFVVGSDKILKTTNGGLNWQTFTFSGNQFNSVFFVNNNEGFVAGNDGIVYKTIDGGDTWTLMPNFITFDIYKVFALSSNDIFLATGNGIYKSINGGVYFVHQPSGGTGAINSIDFYDSNNGFAVGETGVAKSTNNAGGTLPVNDAGISSINAFSGSPCPGNYPIYATIKNYGTNILSGATIKWSMNGTSQTPVVWTGTLNSDSVSTPVFLSNYFFTQGSTAIKAWTENPNSVADNYTTNDTTSYSAVISKLSGIYTIGGTNPDFATFTLAVTALNNNGICGPVIFKVRNGTYSENNVYITDVVGASSTNTITFESESGSNTSVILASTTSNTISLARSKYISFKNMTINSPAANNILLSSGVSNVTIQNCIMQTGAGYYGISSVINNSYNKNIYIVGNSFVNCKSAIYLNALDAYPDSNIVIENNNFSQFANSGIQITNQKDFKISGNNINSSINILASIYLQKIFGGKIFENKIIAAGGIVALTGNANLSTHTDICNNFCSSTNNTSALYCISVKNLNINFNTFFAKTLNNPVCDISVAVITDNNITFSNNIVYNDSVGVALKTEFPTSTDPTLSFLYNNIDNNCYKTKGINLFSTFVSSTTTTNYNSLVLWNNATGRDLHSIETNPQFINYTDLHIYPNTSNYQLSMAGSPISGITTDIDGDIRDANTPDIGADEFPISVYDAGIESFCNNGQICSGTNSIYLKIKNYGTQTLANVAIKYRINGGSIQTFNWTGSLATNQVSTDINVGSYAFIQGQSYVINAGTYNPNGNTDQANLNDTLSSTILSQGLSGTYVIGTAPSDYTTINSAISALTTYGICSDVVFDIKPGTYAENLTIPQISGSGQYSSITFKSQNSDSTSVIISVSNNYVVTLNGADYITFRNITVTSATSYSCFRFTNNTNHNNIIGCVLNGGTSDVIDISSTALIFGNTISQNAINNGSRGISSSGYSNGLTITNNVFVNNSSKSINLVNPTNFDISNNVLKNIYINNCSSFNVSNNFFNSTDYCINLINCISTSVNQSNLINNFCTTSGSYAIYFTGTNRNVNIFYNSINNTNIDTSSSGINILTTCQNIDIKNNNIACSQGKPFKFDAAQIININPNYNNLYTSGPNIANTYSSLYNWQVATGKDLNSINFAPGFTSGTDLHIPNNYYINATGSPITDIITDIDGETRNTQHPDIGADEINIAFAQNDAGVWIIDNNLSLCNNHSSDVAIKIRNFGVQPLTSAVIKWTVNNIPQPNFNWTGNLVTDEISNFFVIGSTIGQSHQTYNIKVWSELPNLLSDIVNVNDTIRLNNVLTKLSGTYTIGGSTPDFTTFNQTIVALNTCGVCDSVIFKVRDGSYNEFLTFQPVTGTSSTSPIIFESESGNSTAVTLTTNTSNKTITINGSDNLIFRNMTISVTGSTSTNVVLMNTGTKNILFKNVKLNSVTTTSILTSKSIVYSSNAIFENCEFDGCTFLNGSFGIYLISGTAQDTGVVIKNCVFTSQYASAVYCSEIFAPLILNNTFTSTTVNSTHAAIYLVSSNHCNIIKNKIFVKYPYGLYLDHSDACQIVNNIIADQSGMKQGIYLFISDSVKIYYNSINIISTASPSSYALYHYLSYVSTVKNNHFINTAGKAAYFDVTWTGSISDYNNYYGNIVNCINVGTTAYNLAGYQTASGREQNSMTDSPWYVSNTDLHCQNPSVYNIGTPIPEVLDDIDGNIRSTFDTDLGAYEYLPLLNDSLVWPGDANHDGYANNYDLLPLGIYFNSTGTTRDSISNLWLGHESIDWANTQNNGANYKHADCNGNGEINASDTVAIHLNYGYQITNKSLTGNGKSTSNIYIIPVDSFIIGLPCKFEIWLGNATNPIDSAYGVGFVINLNPFYIQPGSLQLNFIPSWLGNISVNALSISEKFNAIASVEGALVRTDHNNQNGYGKIADLSFIIDPNSPPGMPLTVSFISSLAVDANGNNIYLISHDTTVTINYITSLNENNSESILVYPNPSHSNLTIELKEKSTVEIINAQGQVVDLFNLTAKVNNIDISKLSSGVYTLRIKTDNGIAFKKLIKQ